MAEEQATCSTEGDTEGSAPEEQMKPGKLDELRWKLDSMDLYLLKYFEGNCLIYALVQASATIVDHYFHYCIKLQFIIIHILTLANIEFDQTRTTL